MPPVGNQGNQGSCVGWAVAYYYKSYQEKKEHNWQYNSKTEFSPSYIYNQFATSNSGGMNPEDAFKTLVSQGVAPFASSPYYDWDWKSQPTAEAKSIAANYKALSYQLLYGPNFGSFDALKEHLASGDPFVMSIPLYSHYQIVGWNVKLVTDIPTVMDVSSASDLFEVQKYRHAITVVGYDDSTQRFKFVNSWGLEWGDRNQPGYGYLTYAFVHELDVTAFAMTDAVEGNPPPPPPPPPPPLPASDNAAFVSDITFPDGSVVSPNQSLTKTWRVQNTGTSTWGSGYQLVFRGGNRLGAPETISVPSTAPGQQVDLSVSLQVPSDATPGTYRASWQLRNLQGTYFGDTIWFSLDIPNPQPTGGNGVNVNLVSVNSPSVVSPGQKFQPKVTVNMTSGQLLQSRGDLLRNTDGNLFGAWPHVAVVGTADTGQNYTFTFYADNPITAPTAEGTYTSKWQVWANNGWVGPEITIQFSVYQAASKGCGKK